MATIRVSPFFQKSVARPYVPKVDSWAAAAQKPLCTRGILAERVALDPHAQSCPPMHFWHSRSNLLAKELSGHPHPPAKVSAPSKYSYT